MTKQTYKVLLVVFILVFGCKNKTKHNKEKDNRIPVVSIKKKQESLLIEGNNVWVRDSPRKGKVVMKLNEGNLCVILDSSKIDTIRGYIDYWYKIKHKDTIGWVFGSQTNIKSAKSKETQLFLKQMKTFVYGLKTRNFKILNDFIFPNEEPVHCVLASSNSDHLRSTITYDFKKISEEYYDIKELLDTLSDSSKSEYRISYANITELETVHLYLRRGIYYQQLNNGNHLISNYVKWQREYSMVPEDDNYDYLSVEHQRYIRREKEVEFRLVIAFDDMGTMKAPIINSISTSEKENGICRGFIIHSGYNFYMEKTS